jgi:alpha-1,2-mannosyltransferase
MTQQTPATNVQAEEGGHWLTTERLAIYPRIFLVVFAVSFAGWVLMSDNLLDKEGKPIGYDFITFWGTSKLTLEGTPESAFDLKQLYEAERDAVSGLRDIYAWHYPPTFQLMVAPLALLPYLAALALWISLTLAAATFVIRRLAPGTHTLLLFIAFPGTYLNFAQGQTGFLTTCLFGGALLLLHERRPILAGILIGLLTYKPQFGLLIPVALVFGRQWTAFISASITAVIFGALSAAILGTDVWLAFLNNLPLLRDVLEQGGIPWGKMASLFTSLRLLGIGIGLAYAFQFLLAALAAAAVAWAWWQDVPARVAGAILAAGALLATPYVFDYDLVLLAIPIALLARDGIERGWLPGEREVLVAAWLTPLLFPVIAAATGIQLGWVSLFAVFAVAVRRACVLRTGRHAATAAAG